MTLYKLLLLSIGAFALLKFLILPLMVRRWKADHGPGAVKKAAALAAVDFMRTLALLASIAYGLVALAIVVLQQQGGVTSAELAASIRRLEGLRELLKGVGTGWSAFLMVTLVALLAVFSYRRGKATMGATIDLAYRRELERLRVERDKGEWEELPSTEQMRALEDQHQRAAEFLRVLEEQEPQPPDAASAHDSVRAKMEQIQTTWHALDWRRRMNVEWNPSVFETERDHGRWAKIKTFFVSEGFLTSLKGGKRWLHRAALLILFVSLVGAQTRSIARATQGRIVTLTDLHVSASQEEALASYDSVLVQHPQEEDADLDESDEEILDALARDFETAVLDDPSWGTAARGGRSAQVLRSFRVRDAVLRTVPTTSSSRRAPRPALERAEGLSTLERASLERYSSDLNARGPRTELGRQARRQLRRDVVSRPRLWEKVKANYRSGLRSFQRPAGVRDVGRLMVGELLGHGMSTVPSVDNEVGRLAQSMAKSSGKASLKRIYDIKLQEFVTDIADGRGLEQAVEKASGRGDMRAMTSSQSEAVTRRLRDMPTAESLEPKVRTQPPGMSTLAERHVNLPRAEAASDRIRAIRTRGATNAPATIATEPFTTYGDHFPGEIGAETRTTRGRILTKRDGAAHPTIRASEAADYLQDMSHAQGSRDPRAIRRPATAVRSSPSVRRFARARSFVRLRGFARVGGVLIGQEPKVSEGDPADLIDLKWQTFEDEIELILVRHDNTEVSLGRFDANLVHAALLYAADGRPTAVTMVTTEPLVDLRILLHPTLLDTPIGCEIIELDRFVDIHTFDPDVETPRDLAHDFFGSADALYKRAWAARLRPLWTRIEAALDNQGLASISTYEIQQNLEALGAETIQSAIAELSVTENDSELDEAAADALADLDGALDPLRTPLSAKPEFYDQDLVDWIAECGRSSADLASSVECITSKARSTLAVDRSRAWARWFCLPPEYQVWSGVRELPYMVDASLSCFGVNGASSTSVLWPFRFMVQVAFTSPPYFGVDTEMSEEFDDENPWEFPALQDYITTTLERSVTNDSTQSQILDDIGSFTVLQRLFRCAFDFQLGDGFAIDRLAELASVAAAHPVPAVRTPRWTPRPGYLEAQLAQLLAGMAQRLDGADDPWITRASATMQRIALALDAPGRESISESEWELRFDIDALLSEASQRCERALESTPQSQPPSCLVRFMCEQIQVTGEARKMRAALGVAVDERQPDCFAPPEPLPHDIQTRRSELEFGAILDQVSGQGFHELRIAYLSDDTNAATAGWAALLRETQGYAVRIGVYRQLDSISGVLEKGARDVPFFVLPYELRSGPARALYVGLFATQKDARSLLASLPATVRDDDFPIVVPIPDTTSPYGQEVLADSRR